MYREETLRKHARDAYQSGDARFLVELRRCDNESNVSRL